jgi:SAM-dependent methyltransferase
MEGWEDMVSATVDCYNTHGENLRTETKDRYGERLHTTFLGALGLPSKGKRVLDLGCGPGRDSVRFQSLGMVATALDGSSTMAEMARDNGCETVLLQDLHDLDLQDASFDGIFAKRSIFHVYSPLLPKVLRQLWCALDDGGVLFSSNARALDELFAGDHDGIHPAHAV